MPEGDEEVKKSPQGAEKGTDLFEEVFGGKGGAGAAQKGGAKARKNQAKEDEAIEPVKGPKKKGAIRVVEGEEKRGLRDKIKRIVVAKAEKAAEQEGSLPPSKEAGREIPLAKEEGIKEEGIKEGAKKEAGEQPVGEKEEKQVQPAVKPPLKFLEHEEAAFIGRKQSVYQKYGKQAGLFLGQVDEEDGRGKKVFLDSLNPHVVFVCGARGSGKSYILGVVAEELALNNKNVGIIVIDPVGVFWSMRFPNKETRELELLAKWDLLPQGLDNLRVFIPKGVADTVPKNTYDATFSIPPALLTVEDWCLTFGIERFSPSGLLLEKSLESVKKGYTNKEGKQVKGKKDGFSLGDLIACLSTNAELSSGDRGYKTDSIRAIASRFDAAAGWGIFDEKGTPLVELSRENQLTVIDTSFLEDSVSALVIGILARRILDARKVSTREETAQRYKEVRDMDSLLEYGVPPTWLFIDEAHALIPSGNTVTPASNALIEYVKQGRQPGCSIVFATQQPSAINTKVLSQLDMMIAHKLVFDDDIKAVYKRTPSIIPRQYRKSGFIKSLPVGVALTGDRREETSRAFVLRVRPRMSQHEGREAETVERETKLGKDKVLLLAVEMGYNKLQSAGQMQSATIDQVVKTLNAKYKSNIKLAEVLKELEKRGAAIDSGTGMVSIPGMEEEVVAEPSGEVAEEVAKEAQAVLPGEEIELLAFPANVNEGQARALFNATRKKRFLGLIGSEEGLESVQLRYLPIYKISLHAFNTKKTFHKAEAYINSISGEFLHFVPSKREFIESKGLQDVAGLSEREARILLMLDRKKELAAIVQQSGEQEATVRRCLKGLMDKGFVGEEEAAGTSFFFLAKDIDLPADSLHPLVSSLNRLPVENASAISLMREEVDRNGLPKALKKLWGNAIVKKVDLVYLPVYEAFLKKKDGSVRRLFIEAVNGKRIELGKAD